MKIFRNEKILDFTWLYLRIWKSKNVQNIFLIKKMTKNLEQILHLEKNTYYYLYITIFINKQKELYI